MAFTCIDETPIGDVRAIIPDIAEATPIFQDNSITTFLRLEGDSVKLACALALETISTDQVLLLKYIETNALKTDGSKVADSLLKRAKDLRDRNPVAVETPGVDTGSEFELIGGPCNDVDDFLIWA